MTKMMGFIRPYNIGPGWLKQCKPPKSELAGITGLGFAHVLPAHGEPVIDDALGKYAAVIATASV
jgi:hypothetical protein